VGIGIFDLFGSCDLDLDPMTFIYELNPYPLETYPMCESARYTSKLSKLVEWAVNACNWLRVATSGHVTKVTVTSLDPPYRSQKPHRPTTRKPGGSIFYRTGVMGDRSFH